MAAYKNLRWKTLTIVAVVLLFAAVGVYPILAQSYGLPAPAWLMAKQLKLGLDLKGGVHLVMRVNRDDALRISTETAGEQLREALQAAGVSVGSINVTSPTTLRVEGVPQDRDAEFRRIAEEQPRDELRPRVWRRRRVRFHHAPQYRPEPPGTDDGAGARHDRPPGERARRDRTQYRHAR